MRPDGLFEAPYQWQIGKVALDSPAGWIAFANQAAGAAFTISFDVVPGADYPDGGATVEVWTVGAGEVGNLDYEQQRHLPDGNRGAQPVPHDHAGRDGFISAGMGDVPLRRGRCWTCTAAGAADATAHRNP